MPQAFTTGQVQAMITSPSTGADSAAWDYVDTYTAIDAWFPKNVVVVNQSAFDALPADQQKAVMDAAAAAETRGWAASAVEAETKKKAMADHGMKIVAPSPELIAGLKAIGDTMLAKWKASASPDALSILTDYQK